MTKPEVIAFLVLLAAAIAFTAPRLVARADDGAVFAGACAERAHLQECATAGFSGIARVYWR